MNVNIGKPTDCKCGETAGKGIISLNLQGGLWYNIYKFTVTYRKLYATQEQVSI